jgi:hypothetical protein
MATYWFPIGFTIILWLWYWVQNKADMMGLIALVIGIYGTIAIWVGYFFILGVYTLFSGGA